MKSAGKLHKSRILIGVLLVGVAGAVEALTDRRISSDDIGTVVFKAPETWEGTESYDDLEAASVYELSNRKEKFNLRISVKHAGFDSLEDQTVMDNVVIARLDAYLEYALAEYFQNAVEGEIIARRFGKRNHGIYARMPNRNAGESSYPYFSHGARVFGDKLVIFSLYSSDQDYATLKTTLDVVESFKSAKEWANAPDAFLCNVEQAAGFDVVDKEWDAVTSKKVKHSYLVRRSRPDDAFADASEWVFLSVDRDKANTYCDDEFITRGIFICNGVGDEEFRMDSKTLRFIYVYIGGYHDVAPGVVPEENSPLPHMEIGSCEAQQK